MREIVDNKMDYQTENELLHAECERLKAELMTTEKKLGFILRAIVTAGGPEQTKGISDEAYLLAVTEWLIPPTVIGWENLGDGKGLREITRDKCSVDKGR